MGRPWGMKTDSIFSFVRCCKLISFRRGIFSAERIFFFKSFIFVFLGFVFGIHNLTLIPLLTSPPIIHAPHQIEKVPHPQTFHNYQLQPGIVTYYLLFMSFCPTDHCPYSRIFHVLYGSGFPFRFTAITAEIEPCFIWIREVSRIISVICLASYPFDVKIFSFECVGSSYGQCHLQWPVRVDCDYPHPTILVTFRTFASLLYHFTLIAVCRFYLGQ